MPQWFVIVFTVLVTTPCVWLVSYALMPIATPVKIADIITALASISAAVSACVTYRAYKLSSDERKATLKRESFNYYMQLRDQLNLIDRRFKALEVEFNCEQMWLREFFDILDGKGEIKPLTLEEAKHKLEALSRSSQQACDELCDVNKNEYRNSIRLIQQIAFNECGIDVKLYRNLLHEYMDCYADRYEHPCLFTEEYPITPNLSDLTDRQKEISNKKQECDGYWLLLAFKNTDWNAYNKKIQQSITDLRKSRNAYTGALNEIQKKIVQ